MFLRSNGLRTPAPLVEPKTIVERTAVPRSLTWIVGGTVGVLGTMMFFGGVHNSGSYLGGLSALSVLLWLVSGFTGAYAAVTGRRTWLRLRNRRRSGAVLLGVSLGFFVLASALLAAAG